MTKIKDVNGLVDDSCKCGSWLDHWNKHNNKPAVFCSEIRCTQMSGLRGIHVKNFENDNTWYIVPLCKKHWSGADELTINNFTKLIPNSDDDCG